MGLRTGGGKNYEQAGLRFKRPTCSAYTVPIRRGGGHGLAFGSRLQTQRSPGPDPTHWCSFHSHLSTLPCYPLYTQVEKTANWVVKR